MAYLFWHSIWHSFWHILWSIYRSIWHLFWHTFLYSDILSGIYLESVLTFYPAFFSGVHSLAFFLASVLTFSLTFFLVFYLTFSLSFGWGLAVPTEIWSWRLRPGSAHCHLALAVAVRQCPLRSGARSWRPAARWNLEFAVDVQKEGRRRKQLIKFRGPHLAVVGNWDLQPKLLIHIVKKAVLTSPKQNWDFIRGVRQEKVWVNNASKGSGILPQPNPTKIVIAQIA